MREVDGDAYADMIRVLDDMAARVGDVPEYILVDPHCPAGVVIYGSDAQGRPIITCSQEAVDAIPRAPHTGTALSALAGIPVRRLRAVKD